MNEPEGNPEPQEKLRITPDYYSGHGYRGDGIHGCDVMLAGSVVRCGAGMFQHMWVTEYYSDDNDDE